MHSKVLLRCSIGTSCHGLALRYISDIDSLTYCSDSELASSMVGEKHEIRVSIKELLDIQKCASIRNMVNLHSVEDGDAKLVQFIRDSLYKIQNISGVDTYNSVLKEYLVAINDESPFIKFKYMMIAKKMYNGVSILEAKHATKEERKFYLDVKFGRKTRKDFMEYCRFLESGDLYQRVKRLKPNIDFHKRFCQEIQEAIERMGKLNV